MVNPQSIRMRGELSHRLLLSFSRLESQYYRPDYIFTADKNGWDADWEGRTVLALVQLARATHKEPSYLAQIFDELENRWNPKGYLGKVLPEGECSEQQLSGHNWLLSGLVRYYEWRPDAHVKRWIDAIVENLYIPARDCFREYPLDRRRGSGGSYAGNEIGRQGRWRLSTDVGCAFICFDALAYAYKVFREGRLLPLLEEIAEIFIGIDFVGAGMQTHATLSGLRGLICLYRTTRREEYLAAAKRIFDLYLAEGTTENYANINWFSRPSWTEPCAVVDSLICAMELYQTTGEIRYLELVHQIYLNGIGHAQRPNGGFGCDACCGSDTLYLAPHGKGMGEAIWCCTMRGADGLSYFTERLVTYDDGRFRFLYYNDAEYMIDGLTVTVKTQYPSAWKVSVTVRNPQRKKLVFSLFIPSFGKDILLRVNGLESRSAPEKGFIDFVDDQENICAELTFDIPMLEAAPRTKPYSTTHRCFRHGYLLLSADAGADEWSGNLNLTRCSGTRYLDASSGMVFSGINDVYEMEIESVAREHRQILFAKPGISERQG